MNGPAKENFAEEHKQFFVAFLPHLERALRLYALLKLNEVEKAIYEEALDRLTIGTIILDGRGHVIESNRAALQLLEQSACVSVLEGQVTPARAAHRAELHRLIDDALRGANGLMKRHSSMQCGSTARPDPGWAC